MGTQGAQGFTQAAADHGNRFPRIAAPNRG